MSNRGFLSSSQRGRYQVLRHQQRIETDHAEKTLDVLNKEAGVARNVWIAFNSLLLLIATTVSGVRHEDLFFEKPLRVPFINVDMPLTWFFIVVPLLVLIMYVGVLVEHALLGTKASDILRAIEGTGEEESLQLKQKASTYFYVQNALGAEQQKTVRLGVGLISFATLYAFPIAVLLLIQLQFLPYQDDRITWFHRIIVACAVLSVVLFQLPAASAKDAIKRFLLLRRSSMNIRLRVVATSILSIAVLAVC